MSQSLLLNSAILRMKPSPTLTLSALAKKLQNQGRDVIDLSVGEPDQDTPEFIKDAAREALKKGYTKYTAADGIHPLKEAIVKKFQSQGMTLQIQNITVSSGAKQVLFNALAATLTPEDEVIIPAPYWVSYPEMVTFFGASNLIIPCKASEGFLLTPQQLAQAITPKTKWLILNSPNNPTGACFSRQNLLDLADVLRKHSHVHIICDDIYESLTFNHQPVPPLAALAPDLASRLLTVSGFSKSHAMTGWRLGYGAGPKELIDAMRILQTQSTSHPCSIAQHAGLAALQEPQEDLFKRCAVFKERRDIWMQELPTLKGLRMSEPPAGAFYVFPSCQALIGAQTPGGKVLTTDGEVASYLLEEANVAIVPGAAFGMEPYLRISYTLSIDRLREACHRLRQALDKLSLHTPLSG